MVYLIRHGETDLNKQNLLQGRTDYPLNAAGIRQAKAARDFFLKAGIHFDTVYSSPLSRAVQTAQIVAGEMAFILPDDRLLEMDYGPYEGSDLSHPTPEIIYFFSDFTHNPAPKGMESLSSVVKRMGEFMESIKDSPGNILIATHAIAMKGALEYLTSDSNGRYWSTYISNCGVYQTEVINGEYTIPQKMITQQRKGA